MAAESVQPDPLINRTRYSRLRLVSRAGYQQRRAYKSWRSASAEDS